MTLRPINDTVIIEVEKKSAIDNDQRVLDVIKRGLIVLPEKNSVLKISNRAKIVACGSDRFTPGQEIIYNQFTDRPLWHQTFRIIREHYIQGVFVDNKLRPLGNNLIVELRQAKNQTEGGIFLPEQAQTGEYMGTVKAVGDCKHVQIGQTVLFGEYAGNEIILNSRKCKILKETEVLGIYES